MRMDLHRFGTARPPANAMALAASSVVAGLSLGLLVASHGFWAEARPGVQAGVAALLLAAAALLAVAMRPFSSRPGETALRELVSQQALIKDAGELLSDDRQAALILLELTGLAWMSRTERGETAEKAIRAVESRLSALLPRGSRASRWSEERFLLLMPGSQDRLAVLSLARDLTGGLTTGPAFAALPAAVTCHAGIVMAPADGITPGELIQNAELALAEARRQDRPGYGFFAPELAAEAQRRLALQRAVKEAVSSDALRLEFQPVYDMRSGTLTGFEALIRLHDPELGRIPPSEFIPLAEQSGAIVEIGQWAVEEACRVAAQWPAHLVVAVNLSPAELQSGALVSHVRRALQRHALPAYRLEVEITEGTLMTESELVLGQLRLLRDMGVGVALDDFGTGYSSLSYLCRFPFSKLKIDRSFAAALDHSASARNVLRAIVKLGHGLGMTVTAEGIETARQLSLLRDIGCDLAQGYLLGRPAPLGELAAIILRNFAQGLARRPRAVGRKVA